MMGNFLLKYSPDIIWSEQYLIRRSYDNPS